MSGRTDVDVPMQDRLLLVNTADKFPNHLKIKITSFNGVDSGRLPKDFEEDKVDEEICEQLNHYKYMVIVDGDSSSWLRAPLILYSNAVPLLIETRFAPLY